MSKSFIIERDALLEVARAASRPVESRNTMPILGYLLMEVDHEWLTVRGTDLHIAVEVRVQCESAEKFSTTIPASRLIAAADTLRPAPVLLTVDAGKMVMKQGRSTRTMPTLPAGDFPKVKMEDAKAEFIMEGKDFAALLDAAKPAMANEVARYWLNGVFLHVNDGRLTAAASDGNRLLRITTDLPLGANDLPPTILSAKSVSLLSSMLAAATGAQVKLRVGEAKVEATFGRVTVVMKVVDGTYPDYARAIPPVSDRSLKVHASELMRALRAGASMTDVGKVRAVKLGLAPDGCNIVGRSAEEEAVEPVDAEFGADPFEIGINASLALPVVAAFGEAAELQLSFTEANNPILFTSTNRPAITAVMGSMRI